MKHLLWMLVIFSTSRLGAVDPKCVRQEFDGVSFARYYFETRPVWSDAEKNDIIFNHNKELTNLKFSTNATAKLISDADFIPVVGVDATIALTTTTFNLPLRANAWFVPVLHDDDVVKFLNAGVFFSTWTTQSNGYYNKLAVQVAPQ